jgi:N-methylhydantoinase B
MTTLTGRPPEPTAGRGSGGRRRPLDPVTLAVLGSALTSLSEEMGGVLRRSSYSPIIREMLDYSCAVFDADGQLVAQGEFIPAQLGAMALVVRATLERHRETLQPGDVFVANDPYAGGAHTPDVNVIRPVFEPGGGARRRPRLLAWVGTVAHQVDVGGPNPGTEGADHRDTFAEGLVLPPVRLADASGPDSDLLAVIAANVRDPVATLADLRAQMAACRLGERRLIELHRRYGGAILREAFAALLDHAERRTRAALVALPDGTAQAAGCLDDDGAGGPPLEIGVRLSKEADTLTVDLSAAPASPGALNVPWASTVATVLYVVRAVCDPTIPANEGVLRALRIHAPLGTLFNPRPPAAVSVRHLACQRLADLLLRAAATLWPEAVPLAGHFVGFFSLMAVGPSPRTGRPVVLQDVVGGGTGAHGPRRLPQGAWQEGGDGLDGVDTHLSNVGLLPAEVCELEYPWRLWRSELVAGSGGRGRWRGGRGIRRVYEALAGPQPVVLYCEQTDPRFRPWGAVGGGDGRPTRLRVLDPRGRSIRVAAKGTVVVSAGTRIVVETGGGGGWGSPARQGGVRRGGRDGERGGLPSGADHGGRSRAGP